jgi:dTDP-4-dehydrorhamnose 3,5-epimerase
VKFHETAILGAFRVEAEPLRDERGFFARTFSRETFVERGLFACAEQTSISWNEKRGTLRGMHWQCSPYEEAKLVTCVRGAIFDVLLDVRLDSATYGLSATFELREDVPVTLYVPPGVAHGFQTLENDTLVLYQMSVAHSPECSRAIRYDDPTFGIAWPIANPIVSERDRSHPFETRRFTCAS